jgi:hypothetical protein
MRQDKPTAGFTIVELMLAMTFISMLLIAIALTTIQISNIYNKGITLREVNQAGRSLSDEFQRNISNTTPFDVTPKAGNDPISSKFVSHTGGGRLCLGNYTYAWNYGEMLASGTGIYNRYADNNEPVRFVRVRDPNGGLCSNVATQINRDDAVELLSSGDRDLAVHKFDIQRTKDDSTIGQSLYAISFVLGTNNQNQLTANDASCRPPSENVGDENYCAVNQFDIIARAGNASGGQ